MKRMFEHEVLPRLPGGTRVIRRARINCFGVGESAAEELLGDLTARGRDPDIGITVHEATITLRITATGESVVVCEEKIATASGAIRERMGDLVFGEEDDELEHVVVRMLVERGLTLATAESGTGGLLAHRITEVPLFEKCYRGGLVAPTKDAKSRSLGVSGDTLESTGAASPETAREMARGCRERFGCDFALAITECPRFSPEDPSSAVPKANVALAGEGVLIAREHTLLGDLALVKSRAAKIALNLLRLHLMRQNPS
jgi:nicotinamide-nucleotide amidase